LGARLLYALEHVSAYVAAPLSLLAPSATALDPWGGLLVGAAVAGLYGRAQRLPLRATLDALAPGLAVFMIAVGAANVLGGSGYGSPLKAPWAMLQWGEYRHPTQIYETVLALVVFLGWKFMQAGSMSPGNRFWLVAGLSATARRDQLGVIGEGRGHAAARLGERWRRQDGCRFDQIAHELP